MSATVRVYLDGDAWCALSGPDLQEGVSGFGSTPAEALRDLANTVDLTVWPTDNHGPEHVTPELPPAATLLADNIRLRAENDRLRECLLLADRLVVHRDECDLWWTRKRPCNCGYAEFQSTWRPLASPTGDRPNG